MSPHSLSTLEQYGNSFQTKVISGLLTNKKFLVSIHDVLSDEYFSSSSHKWIINQVLEYFEKFHTIISIDVLKVEVKKIDNDILKVSIKEQIKEAYKSSDSDDLEYVESEFSNFCKNQQLKKALLNSVDLLNAGDYDSIRTLVNNALKAGGDKEIGMEYEKDIETRYREDARGNLIATPWKEINDLVKGGLGANDLSLIFGGPGGGKSWFLVALGATAALNGFNVIHYTLELSDIYSGLRYDSFLTGIPFGEIQNHRDKVEETISKIPGKIIIQKYPPKKANIHTLENHIQRCTELGTKPDLIIIDYIDYLGVKSKGRDRKEEIDDVYVAAKALACDLEIPIWSASQVNRAGAKDDVVEGDKAAGSYDKIMICDFIMSISRKRKDKVDGTGRLSVMKNRYGKDGVTYNAKINTDVGEFKILGLYDEEDEEEERSNKTSIPGIDKNDKRYLKDKFFELEKNLQ